MGKIPVFEKPYRDHPGRNKARSTINADTVKKPNRKTEQKNFHDCLINFDKWHTRTRNRTEYRQWLSSIDNQQTPSFLAPVYNFDQKANIERRAPHEHHKRKKIIEGQGRAVARVNKKLNYWNFIHIKPPPHHR